MNPLPGIAVSASLAHFAACAPSPTIADDAPAPCNLTREFAFVGDSTLEALDFAFGRVPPDAPQRPGRFWVTAGPIEPPSLEGVPASSEGIPARFDRPPVRLVCVVWADGGPGFVAGSIEADWLPPWQR